jgi:hypothetical protein
MKMLSWIAALSLLACATTANATPCTDACVEENTWDNVDCVDKFTWDAIYLNPQIAKNNLNLCILGSNIAMSDCLQDCFGAPPTGPGPTAVTTATTPGNRTCWTQSDLIQVAVTIDSLNPSESVERIVFYRRSSVQTIPPVLLGVDSTAADGFNLAFRPSDLKNDRYYITYLLYNEDPVWGFLGSGGLYFDVNNCSSQVPLSAGWTLVVTALLLSGGAVLFLNGVRASSST